MAFSYLMPYGLPKWLVIKSTNKSNDKKNIEQSVNLYVLFVLFILFPPAQDETTHW